MGRNLLALVFLFFLLAGCVSSQEKESFSPESQQNALAAHEKLFTSFLSPEGGEEVYPDDYGGCYIEGDILHILIVGLREDKAERYEAILGDLSAHVVFEDVTYAYNTLEPFSHEVMEDLLAEGISVYYVGVDVRKNGVLIGVAEEDLSKLGLTALPPAGGEEGLYAPKEGVYDLPVWFTAALPIITTG